MKKSRFRWRITLWFSLALLLMCLLMGIAVISLYRVKIENDVLDQLQLTVDQCAEIIGKEPEVQAVLRGSGAKEIESSVFLQDSVFLTIYHEDQTRACGLFLYGEDKEIPLHDGQIRRLKAEGSRCCLYDRYIALEDGGLWVRGLAYSGTDTAYLLSGLWDILLVFPLILAAALLGGYWLAGRFLHPVSRISRTAENIRKSGDLTRRVKTKDTGDELAALAENFNAMFDRLEKNFEAERQFTSNASHELRTPVTVILAQCEYALTNTVDHKELKEALQVVQRQGYRMSQLIETLLLLTRIEQNTGDYPMEDTNVSALTRDICQDAAMLPEQEITLETEIREGIWLKVNPRLYRTMLDNLLRNAYRYGREKGKIQVSLTEENGIVRLKVKDNGMGIEEKDLPHIWERFYRGGASRKKKGLGLGLSMAWQIVQYHRARITVESAAGKGTEFCVRFDSLS